MSSMAAYNVDDYKEGGGRYIIAPSLDLMYLLAQIYLLKQCT